MHPTPAAGVAVADGVEYPVAIKELKSQGSSDELSAIEREGVRVSYGSARAIVYVCQSQSRYFQQ